VLSGIGSGLTLTFIVMRAANVMGIARVEYTEDGTIHIPSHLSTAKVPALLLYL